MEVIFRYNGKIISTPNLEKKLKKMKISINDIEIIETPIKKTEEKEEEPLKEMVIVRSSKDNIRRVCYVDKGTRPPLKELFKNHIWKDGIGIKELDNNFIETMYYEESNI